MYSISMLALGIEVERGNLCSVCSLLHKKAAVPRLVAYFVQLMFPPVSLTATGACVCVCYLCSFLQEFSKRVGGTLQCTVHS